MQKNQEKYISLLKNLGLSEHEALVYFASLSLGPSTVLSIARASGVKRTTIYTVIESLKQQGLMAEELKGFKTVFLASRPEKLKEVEDKRKQLLDAHLNELTAIYRLSSEEGTIQYFEGLSAIKTVYEDILRDAKPHDFYFVIADVAKWRSLDEEYFDKFVERRGKTAMEMRLISTDSERARQQAQYARNFNQNVKIMPAGTSLSTSLLISPTRLVIHQYNPPISAIVIRTKSAIQLQKEMFEIMWKAME